MTLPIRWLHLSDFHVGKDNYAQRRLFDKTVAYIKSQCETGFVPDLIFLTGDIANKAAKQEYEAFRKEFYVPLLEAVGKDWGGKVLAVPGNHDVDRTTHAAFDRAKLIAPGSRAFDASKEGHAERKILLPRFKHYRKLVPSNVVTDWINLPEGAYFDISTLKGHTVGVVGINTAWLSADEYDRGKLSPGFHLVEAAFDKIKDCQIRVVLGHHPLNWLNDDESYRLRALLGEHHVIYLHGHLHRAEVRGEDGAGNPFLTFQAGASFQTRDDTEKWRNGLTRGEFDLTRKTVRVSPCFWNPANRDWPVETGRFPENKRVPGTDWWEYSLPGHIATSAAPSAPETPAITVPRGWEILDRATFDSHRREILRQEAAEFFDGAEPGWALALCPDIPRREVVGRLVKRIADYSSHERPLVVLTLGPGGEGKSMALRQTLVALTEHIPDVRVLWHRDDLALISGEQLLALPEGDAPWVIATDSADLTAESLHRSIEVVARGGRRDFRFLLMARESDWRLAGANKLPFWRRTTLQHEPLSGLTEGDAQVITQAWTAFGLDGGADTAHQLFEAARQEATVDEGALLGGILAVRKGDGLRAHVKALLDRLGEVRLAGGGSLYVAFKYIAAMHAEGLRFLSRPVLGEALGCDATCMQEKILFPLAREAAAGGGTLLLTRHRRIALAAVEVMREEYGEDVDACFSELAVAAVRIGLGGVRVPSFSAWQYDLPGHFLKVAPHLAIRIGGAVLEQAPDDPYLAVNLARLHRKSGDPASGAMLLRDFRSDRPADRGFWYEWGTCAGGTGDYVLGAWLAGWSLADAAAPSDPLGNEQAKRSLAGLGVAFEGLYEQHHDPAFIAARGAVAQLGLRLVLDPRTKGYFERYQREAEEAGVTQTDLAGAITRLAEGLHRAWEHCVTRETLRHRLPEPREMQFEGLRRLCAASNRSIAA